MTCLGFLASAASQVLRRLHQEMAEFTAEIPLFLSTVRPQHDTDNAKEL